MSLAVFVSDNVFLPGRENPGPATIEVDSLAGRITTVHDHRRSRDKYPEIRNEDWHDYGGKWLLPGLIEYVFNTVGLFCLGPSDGFQSCISQLVPTST